MKRYTTRIGMGVDVVGGDVTQAALKAIGNARRTCLAGGTVQYGIEATLQPTLPFGSVRLHSPTPDAIDIALVREHYPGIGEIEVSFGGVQEMSAGGDSDLLWDNFVLVVATVLTCEETVALPVGGQIRAQVVEEGNRVVVYHEFGDAATGQFAAAR